MGRDARIRNARRARRTAGLPPLKAKSGRARAVYTPSPTEVRAAKIARRQRNAAIDAQALKLTAAQIFARAIG